jgi:hypothetical protein
MAIDLESRTPHREPRNLYPEPDHPFADNASPFWTIVAAALAAALLVWVIAPSSSQPPISVDTSAVPMAAPSSVAR